MNVMSNVGMGSLPAEVRALTYVELAADASSKLHDFRVRRVESHDT
jgi:hypothetical protein